MLESFTMLLSIDCEACRTPMPVNGIVPWVRCHGCEQVRQLDAGFWTSAMEPDYFGEALGFENGEGRQVTSMGHPEYRLSYGRRIPRCQACKGPDLDLATLGNFLPRGRCFCPACGNAINVRPADDLCRSINPRAQFVVHETFGEAPAATGASPLFPCLGCGAGISADGSARTVVCGKCQAQNFVPDALWRQLRPPPVSHGFFLVCAYDEAARAEARWADDDVKQQDAARADLTYEQFAKLAKDEDDDVREIVARNPACPQDLLYALIKDEDSDVRCALAENPAASFQLLDALAADEYYETRQRVAASLRTHPATLFRLVNDDDSAVEEALIANPNLPAEAVEALARSEDYGKRVAAAKHPLISMETLRQLARDEDSDVEEAAKARLRGR